MDRCELKDREFKLLSDLVYNTIGINLGDIVADEDDIHGDGVNIAARIESVAPSGGICISGAVYDQVHHKIKDLQKLEDALSDLVRQCSESSDKAHCPIVDTLLKES